MLMQEKHSSIQNRLWKYRKAQGLTQKQVAHLIGLKSPSQIHRWEKGKRNPNLRQAIQLSCIYKRMVNDLFWELYIIEREQLGEEYELVIGE